jgi:hypothetical protein
MALPAHPSREAQGRPGARDIDEVLALKARPAGAAARHGARATECTTGRCVSRARPHAQPGAALQNLRGLEGASAP